MRDALSLKKAVLAHKLGDVFAGRVKSVNAAQTTAALAWAVPGMAPMTQNTTDIASTNTGQTVNDDLPAHLV